MKYTTIAEELKCGNSVTCFTVGVSMRPLLIERKTHVTVVPIENAQNGDILMYVRSNGKYVLHRLIKQDGQFYYMRGDNTFGLERIEKTKAIGVVNCIYRKGKSFYVSNKKYRAYVIFWTAIYPLRFCINRAGAAMKALLKNS